MIWFAGWALVAVAGAVLSVLSANYLNGWAAKVGTVAFGLVLLAGVVGSNVVYYRHTWN